MQEQWQDVDILDICVQMMIWKVKTLQVKVKFCAQCELFLPTFHSKGYCT